MKLHPFIAAEKPAVRNVKKTCTLLCVSRSAFYQSQRSEPSAHEQHDVVLEERIVAIHEESRRTTVRLAYTNTCAGTVFAPGRSGLPG